MRSVSPCDNYAAEDAGAQVRTQLDERHRPGGINVGLWPARVPKGLQKGIAFSVRMAPDGKSFIYAVAGRDEILFYRQRWQDGKCTGEIQNLCQNYRLRFP